MDVFIFQAALICTHCAQGVMGALPKPDHVDMHDESSYDSDDWPKGPYPDGGGESDCPQHCDMCGVFLDAPLTADGSAYVKDIWHGYWQGDGGKLEVLREWRDAYPNEWAEFCADAESAYQTDGPRQRLEELST